MDTIYKSDTKRVFLTFDDGPSPVTSKILDILKQENVKATFFILGSNVDSRKDVVKRMYEEGHYLANHGYSHTYSKIYSSPQSVLDEYNECNDKVKNAIEVPDYNLEIEDLLRDDIFLEFPAKLLCKKDCKGLCQRCGKNLNDGECGCDKDEPDPRLAVLKALLQ